MTEERYKRCIDFVTATKRRRAVFAAVYKVLPVVVFAAYPVLLITLFLNKDSRLLACILVPLFMFVTLTIARYFINAQRPYEKFDISPVFPKSTVGKSFPSRHTASAAVIAFTILYVSPPFGAAFVAIALLIAASRVIGGVHFPKDVIAGILYAALCAVALIFI